MSQYEIKFVYNWNNKLNMDCFTTIRPHNPKKYVVGRAFDIHLKTKDGWNTFYDAADIVEIKTIKGKDLNEFITRLDMGLSLDDGKRLLNNFYKNKCPDVMEMSFDFILLAYQAPRKVKGQK